MTVFFALNLVFRSLSPARAMAGVTVEGGTDSAYPLFASPPGDSKTVRHGAKGRARALERHVIRLRVVILRRRNRRVAGFHEKAGQVVDLALPVGRLRFQPVQNVLV